MSHKALFHRQSKRHLQPVTESGDTVNNIEVLLKLEQQRLEKLRQDVHLLHLAKAQRPSLRSRTAKTLHRLALRLYPEVELQPLPLHQKS